MIITSNRYTVRPEYAAENAARIRVVFLAEPSGDAPSPEPSERASWSGGGPAVPAQEEQTRPLSWPQQEQTRPLRRPPQEDPPTARFGLHP